MFDVAFQELVLFIGPGFFNLWRDALRFAWNFELQRWHFNGIQLLQIFSQNKSIFSQTKYAVIHLQLRPT